nr:hypothetical protein [Pandoravirus massiliensis]
MRALDNYKEGHRDRNPHDDDINNNKKNKNKKNESDDADHGKAFESMVKPVLFDLIARHRRQVTGHAVIDQVRRQGHGDASKWLQSLGDHQLATFLSRLSCVHRALVVEGRAGDNVFIVPATLVRRPMSAKRARREWGQAPHWVARAWTLVSSPEQCRRAVADLRQRPFISVVVDASQRHDLGLVHIAALGDGVHLPRCYTFDMCVTPEMEWCGAGDLFGAGGLADLLGDARLPKAVCGFGCGHSRIAHRQSEALMRTPIEIATRPDAGSTGVMVRSAVNVLPLTDSRVSGAVGIALEGRYLDLDSWQRAGAAIVNDKWQWQRRPLPVALWADAAQRAFSLCVAYEALCDIAGSIEPARDLVAQRSSDGLLCFAAAQALAQATWKNVASPCSVGADDPRAPQDASEWDELERAVRSYIDAEDTNTMPLPDVHAPLGASCIASGPQSSRIPDDVGVVADNDHGSDCNDVINVDMVGGTRGDPTCYACAGADNVNVNDDDDDDWYGDGQGACADASDPFYEPPGRRLAVWSRAVIEFQN